MTTNTFAKFKHSLSTTAATKRCCGTGARLTFATSMCARCETAALAEQAAYSRHGIELLVEEACNEGRVPCAHYKEYPS